MGENDYPVITISGAEWQAAQSRIAELEGVCKKIRGLLMQATTIRGGMTCKDIIENIGAELENVINRAKGGQPCQTA